MNIFYLDYVPKICAQYHVDRHVVKMTLESAQMLSTAHWTLDGTPEGPCYKPTHVNHPCSKWVRESTGNYAWLFELMCELDIERRHRYGGPPGKTIMDLGDFLVKPPKNLPYGHMTPPPQAMPTECMHEDPITAYRQYYRLHKQHIAHWTNRERPYWYD